MSIRRTLARINSVQAINPVAIATAAVIKGVAIDRVGALPAQPTGITAYTAYTSAAGIYNSANVLVAAGTATGAPTAQSVVTKIQHSDTTTDGDFVDAPAETYIDTPAALVADNTNTNFDVNLAGLKRYIRVVATLSFTAGTAPAQYVVASVALGDGSNDPAN